MDELVPGNCPMGCGEQLVLREGQLRCADPDCLRPTAAAEILADTETEHIVTVTEDGWIARHPLRERLDDALDSCVAIERATEFWGPEHKHLRPGRYRVEFPMFDCIVWTELA